MNEKSFESPDLNSLEAQLAAIALTVPPETAQRYLYECGRAAGAAKARTALRGWKILSSALAVAVIVVSLPRFSPPSPVPGPSKANTLQARTPVEVELDAWQLPETEDISPRDDLTRLAQNDPRLRSRTVAALTQQALEHQ